MTIKRTYNHKDKETLERLLKNGFHCKKIAELCNVKVDAVYEWISKYKLKYLKCLKRLVPSDENIVYDWLNSDMVQSEIAFKYNITERTVRNKLRRFGVPQGCKTKLKERLK